MSWGSANLPDMLTVRYERVQESFEACTVFINIYATCTSTNFFFFAILILNPA